MLIICILKYMIYSKIFFSYQTPKRVGVEGSPGEEIALGRDREGFLANSDGAGERRTATTTIEVGSPTDLPFFVVFLQICKIVVPIGFGFGSPTDMIAGRLSVQNGYFFCSVSVVVHMFAPTAIFFEGINGFVVFG